MKTVNVVVACKNASGMADMVVYPIELTEEAYDLGEHYVIAEAKAEEENYEGPFLCFDDAEQPAIVAALKTANLIPSVVAVDISMGLVNSVRCDAGEILVVCYDDQDKEIESDNIFELPLGQNGATVEAWTDIGTADVDPCLKGLPEAVNKLFKPDADEGPVDSPSATS